MITNNSGSGAYNSTLNNCQVLNNKGGEGAGANNCILSNCFLSGNATGIEGLGGGAFQCTLNNCVLSGNSAPSGGGALASVLNNCLVINNTAYNAYSGQGSASWGGGVDDCIANNCTIAFNTVVNPPNPIGARAYGGGAVESELNNCIVQFNSIAPYPYGYNEYNYNYYLGTITNCCTSPLLYDGTGNFTSNPIFVNSAGGDYHLQTNSPCIDAGNNVYVTISSDLDGRPRIINRIVDIGAYEFQGPFNTWLQQFGLPTNGAADFIDTDGDGMNNYQEWIAGTNPTNAASVLELASPSQSISGISVTWQSVSTETYYLQSSTNLSAQPAFTFSQSNIVGKAGSTSYTDTTATNGGPYFYRVGVQ